MVIMDDKFGMRSDGHWAPQAAQGSGYFAACVCEACTARACIRTKTFASQVEIIDDSSN
jgi:hypothetical protein